MQRGHLLGIPQLPRTDPPGRQDSRAHGERGITLPACRHDALLPFGVVRRVGHVGEDVSGTTGYLDAPHDLGHLASFVTISCGLISSVVEDGQVELAEAPATRPRPPVTSLIAVRHSSDEPNPTDVTRRQDMARISAVALIRKRLTTSQRIPPWDVQAASPSSSARAPSATPRGVDATDAA
jgi:hypothetical protein